MPPSLAVLPRCSHGSGESSEKTLARPRDNGSVKKVLESRGAQCSELVRQFLDSDSVSCVSRSSRVFSKSDYLDEVSVVVAVG